MTREIIYGVCDKTGTCDSYYGFFKNYDDATKEVATQAKRLKEDMGLMDIVIKEDRAVLQLTEREEKIVIVIHQYVLR
jgi:hypothetical protein